MATRVWTYLMKKKKCSQCKQEKEISDFNKLKKSSDGLKSYCRECQKKYQKLYRINNRDRLNKYNKQYNKLYSTTINKEKRNEYQREYYQKHKHIINEKRIIKKPLGPYKYTESVRRWYAANKNKHKMNVIAWRNNNPEKRKKYQREYSQRHPELKKAQRHKRRSRIKMAEGSFMATDIKSLLKRQRGKCVVCKVNISKTYHIDHIMPLAKGGSNKPSNIQLLCPNCNLHKSAKHPIDFMQSMGFLL